MKMKISYQVKKPAIKAYRGACFAKCCINFAALAMGEV
jgi:hypothetical protein